eukprot:9476646-Pyramimonas_sp.AAC.1
MEGRQPLITAIKAMTQNHGMWKHLASTISGLIDLRDLEEQVQKDLQLRESARTMIAVRSGLSIIAEGDGTLVKPYFAEMKSAKASIPARLRKELDKLASSAGEDAGEGEDAGDDAEQAACADVDIEQDD